MGDAQPKLEAVGGVREGRSADSYAGEDDEVAARGGAEDGYSSHSELAEGGERGAKEQP